MGILIYLFYFLLPFERIPTIEVGGFTVKLSYIVGVIMLIALLLKNPLKIFKDKPFSGSDKILILFWLVSALTLFWAENIERSVVVILLWAFVLVLYLVLSRLIENEEIFKKIESAILISTILVCLFGIYQFVGDSLGLSSSWTGLRYWYTKEIADLGFPRIQSVALEPLYFSNFLLVPLYITIKRYITKCHSELGSESQLDKEIPDQVRDDKNKLKSIFSCHFWLLILIFINIVLGISRGAYLALAVTLILMIIYFIFNWKKFSQYRFKLIGIGLTLIISILISYIGVVTLNGKEAATNFRGHAIVADAEKGNSVMGRKESYEQAINYFREKPLTGIGVGNYGTRNQFIGDNGALNFGAVNNIYLEILAETGGVGSVLFIIFIIWLIAELYGAYKKGENLTKLNIVLIFLGVLAIFIQYNFFSTLYIIYIWAFLGLLKSEIIYEK
jgi:O-antigen ligase